MKIEALPHSADRADLRLRLVAGERHRLAQIQRQEGLDPREAGVFMRWKTEE